MDTWSKTDMFCSLLHSDHPAGGPLDHDLRHPLRLLLRHQAARGRVQGRGGKGQPDDDATIAYDDNAAADDVVIVSESLLARSGESDENMRIWDGEAIYRFFLPGRRRQIAVASKRFVFCESERGKLTSCLRGNARKARTYWAGARTMFESEYFLPVLSCQKFLRHSR